MNGCCCLTTSKTLPIVGLIVGLCEFVFSCVYNFHTMGFGFSILCFSLSGLILSLTVKEAKRDHNSSFISERESSRENIMAMSTESAPLRKHSSWLKIIWFLYFLLVCLVIVMASVRLLVLSMRFEWRQDLGSKFPSMCGAWAKKDGCTRVALD